MAKTRRLISENLKQVDIVIELLDARIPQSSKNPEIARLCAGKPILTLLNKSSLADPTATSEWLRSYKEHGANALAIDCIKGDGINKIEPEVRRILADKLAKLKAKGMAGRRIRAMIVGVPNCGKSSFVNKLCGTKKAKVEDRPGVTRDKQWVATSIGIDLLDTPGVLWPKFEDQTTGENLAFTGAIRDAILDTETLASKLCRKLSDTYPELFCTRYKLPLEVCKLEEDYEILMALGKKRGFLVSGGEIDTERAADCVLDEFRGAKIGRITLERPERKEKPATPAVEEKTVSEERSEACDA